MANKKLSILFMKDGFSFCVYKENELIHAETVNFEDPNSSLEKNLEQSFQQLLYLNQSYEEVSTCYLSQQFNIIPNTYFEKDNDAQKWLEFSAEVYQDDIVSYEDLDNVQAKIVYAYPNDLKKFVQNKFNIDNVANASKLFLDSMASQSEGAELFLNIHKSQIEILIYQKGQLQLYNIFTASSKEDVVYYVLNSLQQLALDPNEIKLYYFGWHLDNPNLKMLMNFVRHVMPGTSNITELNNFTETQNLK